MELKLRQDIVADALGGAGGESGDGLAGEIRAQRAQLPVFRPELVPPFGNAVRFVDGEERNGDAREPGHGFRFRQTLGRKIQQPVCSLRGFRDDVRLLRPRDGAVQHGRGDSHLSQLRGLILHQGDERRDDDGGAARDHGRQLVAQRFASAGGHYDGGVVARPECYG